jgi:hypothetical protein
MQPVVGVGVGVGNNGNGTGRLALAIGLTIVTLVVASILVMLTLLARPTTVYAQVWLQRAQGPITSPLVLPLGIPSFQGSSLPTRSENNHKFHTFASLYDATNLVSLPSKFGNDADSKRSYWHDSGSLLPASGALSIPALTLTPTPVCDPSWSVVTSPNPSPTLQYLYGVAAISPSDIWAVGIYRPTPSMGWTLTLHWDGNQWSQVPSPNPHPNGTNFFFGVTAVSTNNVWAVGYTYSTGAGTLTLTEHWDGNQWSIVPSPNPDPFSDYLFSVSAASSNDVWAVGYYLTTVGGIRYSRTLTEHWNGNQWSVVPSPNIGTDNNQLTDTTAVSANDVWAVGYYFDTSVQNLRTLVEHWNGVQWSVVPKCPSP